jgi:hypothetical protein
MSDLFSSTESTGLIGILWLICSLLSFINGLIRRLHTLQWLAISLLLGPLALLVGLFLYGRGPKESLFAKRPAEGAGKPDRKIMGDLFQGKPLYSNEVRELKRLGRWDEAVDLLGVLVDGAEEKAREQKRGVPPWYYEQLAVIYRRQGKGDEEIEILERFARQKQAEGEKSRKLLSRLARLKERQGA